MVTKREDLMRGTPNSREKLEEMSIYDLLAIASGLGVPKTPEGKYVLKKSRLILDILGAQKLHDERTTPFREMCGQYTILREKSIYLQASGAFNTGKKRKKIPNQVFGKK
jgi:hypothetical protein